MRKSSWHKSGIIPFCTGGQAMETTELQKKVAFLEFVHDQLVTEIEHVNELLVGAGFPDGIQSLVIVANELIKETSEKENEL